MNKIEHASDLAANSFVNNLLYKEIFRGDEASRISMSKFLFERNISMLATRGEENLHFNYSNDGDLECFFILINNHDAHFSFFEKLSFGLYQLPFRFGLEVTLRLTAKSDWFDSLEQEIMKDTPNYLHLQRMVVKVGKQGQGLGSKYLGKALREVADERQLPVFLGTQEEKNVTFYSRLGFEVVRMVESPTNDPEYSYKTWFMVRQPKSM